VAHLYSMLYGKLTRHDPDPGKFDRGLPLNQSLPRSSLRGLTG